MHDPSSAAAKDIDGAANMITAAISALAAHLARVVASSRTWASTTAVSSPCRSARSYPVPDGTPGYWQSAHWPVMAKRAD